MDCSTVYIRSDSGASRLKATLLHQTAPVVFDLAEFNVSLTLINYPVLSIAVQWTPKLEVAVSCVFSLDATF